MSRILVVDDDPTIVRLLEVNLKLEGYDVSSASNGREALDAISKHRPDMVICDVMMPVMDGVEVVRKLKNDDVLRDLPIVLLSAKAQEIDIRAGKGAGADDYMTKPFDPLDLLALVKRTLAGAKPGKAAKKTAAKKAAKKTAAKKTTKR